MYAREMGQMTNFYLFTKHTHYRERERPADKMELQFEHFNGITAYRFGLHSFLLFVNQYIFFTQLKLKLHIHTETHTNIPFSTCYGMIFYLSLENCN